MNQIVTTPTAAATAVALTRYTATLVDAENEEHKVEIDFLPEQASKPEMLHNAIEILTEARKNLAARTIDYGSFDGDSAYLDALDRRAETYIVVGLYKVGDTKRYEIDGVYGTEGPWTDCVEAVDEEDAEFQGRWQMSINESVDPKDDIAHFLATMEDHEINYLMLKPVTKDELVAAVVALLRKRKLGEDDSAEIVELETMVRSMGETIEQA